MRHPKRIIAGLLTALALTVALGAAWNPLCALYDDGDAMWWLLGCFIDEPPKDGST